MVVGQKHPSAWAELLVASGTFACGLTDFWKRMGKKKVAASPTN